jgi:hypothetical protein
MDIRKLKLSKLNYNEIARRILICPEMLDPNRGQRGERGRN